MRLAISEARLPTVMECWKVPGATSLSRRSRSLLVSESSKRVMFDEYNDETIRNLVNKLVDGQVNAGFFTECPITFRDITIAKQVLVERLKNIYHTRIKYPELNKDIPDENKDQ